VMTSENVKTRRYEYDVVDKQLEPS